MTFFDWGSQDGGVVVSSYIWIYFLVTVVFTAMTLAVWWYFLVYRGSKARGSATRSCLGLWTRLLRLLQDKRLRSSDIEDLPRSANAII